MSPIIITGHPHSGFEIVRDALADAGVSEARPADESQSIAGFYDQLFQASGIDAVGAFQQLAPGKIWRERAAAVLQENAGNAACCWADSRAAALLEFWQDLDPNITFVLVYASPEIALSQALRSKAATSEQLADALADWETVNAALFRFYIRNQDRCLLVNAAAVAQTPRQFCKIASERFGIETGQLGKAMSGGLPVSPLAASLARTLIADSDNSIALYREMEMAADLPGADAAAGKGESAAWHEFLALLDRAETAEASLASQSLWQEEKQKQDHQLDQLTRQLEQLSVENQALKASQADLQAQLAERQQQIAHWQEEKQRQDQQLDQLTRQFEQLSVDKQAVEASQGDLQAQLAEQQQQITQRQNDLDEEIGKGLAQENELLLLQLQQVQEELEYYFQEYKRVSVNTGAPVEATYDLRREIDGANWYKAEATGRWAGPEEVSTLKLPAMGSGEFVVELDVVGAMEPEIPRGMQLSLNGMALELQQNWEKLPARIVARFNQASTGTGLPWEFQFRFPKLVSPAERGEPDTRKLAIRLRSLKIAQIVEGMDAELIQQQRVLAAPEPMEAVYDLRRVIAGSNWYEPEPIGRWAGPGTSSKLLVPGMGVGMFAAEFDVADAIAADILDGLQISLNGMQLEISREGKKFPLRLRSEFSIEKIGKSDIWQFEFEFPRTLSPSERGEADTRKLAIRLRTLKLTAIEGLPRKPNTRPRWHE